MNAWGWLFMITSLGFVWGLTIWCFYKVVTSPEPPPEPVTDFRSA
jgi:hypothetical protein